MINGEQVYAWVFARGGSKGLRGKNLARLDGVPLIGRAVSTGLASQFIDKVFVSTDSEEIAEVASYYGASVPFLRPGALATDKVSERYAWRHAIEWCRTQADLDMEVMVSLPATVPLRNVKDVDGGIQRFAEGDWDTVIAITENESHPSFNLVSRDAEGTASLLSPPSDRIARRQDCIQVYRISGGLYVTNPDFVLRTESYWEGRVGTFQVPVERAVDIDGPLDLEWASFLLSRAKEKGSLLC